MALHLRRRHRANASRGSESHKKVRDAMEIIRTAQAKDELSEPDQDEIVDFALELMRRDYYSSVESLADSLRSEIKRGEIKDEDQLSDRLHEDVDGNQWVIYTKRAKIGLLSSDNEDAADNEGVEANDTSARMYWAMRQDVQDALGDTSDLFEEADEDEED